MDDQSFNTVTRAGTAGGLFTVILMNITVTDMAKTAVLATIGAVVSFGVSLTLKKLVRRWRK